MRYLSLFSGIEAATVAWKQGFPDNYTKINEKTADSPRYKALGNSMAVPVMRWIGERIHAVCGVNNALL